MKRDPTKSSEEQPTSESAPDPKGVKFVRDEDLDAREDMLITAARRVNDGLRPKDLLPEQQKPGK